MAWMCWWSVRESAVSVSQDVGRSVNRPFSDSGKCHQRTIRSTLQICIFARMSSILKWCEKISSLCYFLLLLCNPFVILIFMGICFVWFDFISTSVVLSCIFTSETHTSVSACCSPFAVMNISATAVFHSVFFLLILMGGWILLMITK